MPNNLFKIPKIVLTYSGDKKSLPVQKIKTEIEQVKLEEAQIKLKQEEVKLAEAQVKLELMQNSSEQEIKKIIEEVMNEEGEGEGANANE